VRALAVATVFFIVVGGCSDGGLEPFDYCTPGRPPDDECFRLKRDPGSDNIALAIAIVDKQIEDQPAEELAFNWEEAVLMVGMHALYRITGKEEYQAYYRDWIDHHIDVGYEMVSSDTAAPARLAMELWTSGGEQRYLQVVDDFFTYLYEKALRNEQGGINHLGTDDTLGVTLWVDSLFMFGGVLIRWGEQADDERALEEFATQHGVFTDLLQKEAGWYTHAYNWIGSQDEDVFWGRGNGWVAAATADYLRVLLNTGKKNSAARQAFDKLTGAITTSQDQQTGLWWTVVNHPGETYLETSASALFAWALARAWRYGLVDEPVLETIESAVAGVKDMVETDGQGRPVVTGISGPTMAGDFEYYAGIPVSDDLPFGLGAVVLMLIETSGLFY